MTLFQAFQAIAPANIPARITMNTRKLEGGEIRVDYVVMLAGYTSVGKTLKSAVDAALRRQTIMPDDLEDEESVVAEAAGMETVSI